MNERNFPDFIEAYLKYTSGHEATKKVHMWTCLSIIAGALERRVWLERGYYTLFANLYIFIIGKSGIIRKSTSTGIGVSLLRELPAIKIMSERMTAASLIVQLEAAFKKFESNQKIFQQSALYAYASELAVFMAEVFGSIIELLTTFYDCVPHDAKKPWQSTTKNSGSSKIFGPCLNILGASTMTWLKRYIPSQEMQGGFASRVLFVVEEGNPDHFVAWPEVPKEINDMKALLIKDLIRIYNMSGEFKVDPEARQYFKDWYDNHMKKITDKDWNNPNFSGYFGRKGDHILKLAMVRAASLENDLILRKSHIIWAEKMLESIEQPMFDAFSRKKKEKENIMLVNVPEEEKVKVIIEMPKEMPQELHHEHGVNERHAAMLMEYIELEKQVTEKQIRKEFGSEIPAENMMPCLRYLVDSKLIKLVLLGKGMKNFHYVLARNNFSMDKATL